MRYLPLDDADRQRHAGAHRRRRHRRAVRRHPRRQAARRACSTCRSARAKSRSSARSARWRRAMSRRARRRSSSAPAPIAIMCPATVDHLIQRSEFLTSYTPYQPEIAQGTLQVLFEFQTQVADADRHGGRQRLDVRRLDRLRRGDADGASPDAPQARRSLSGGLHPQYADVAATLAQYGGRRDRAPAAPIPRAQRGHHRRDRRRDVSCVIVQNPDFFGNPARSRRRSPQPRTPRARC